MADFGRFYDLNAESVLRYFYRRTACPETAADLTAETFAAALRSLSTYELGKGPARAWLFGIASGMKGLTALTVLSLIEDGVLGLSTTARSMLGSDLPLIGEGSAPCTLHTSTSPTP